MLSYYLFILYYLWFSASDFVFLIPKEIHIDMQGTAHNMRLVSILLSFHNCKCSE